LKTLNSSMKRDVMLRPIRYCKFSTGKRKEANCSEKAGVPVHLRIGKQVWKLWGNVQVRNVLKSFTELSRTEVLVKRYGQINDVAKICAVARRNHNRFRIIGKLPERKAKIERKISHFERGMMYILSVLMQELKGNKCVKSATLKETMNRRCREVRWRGNKKNVVHDELSFLEQNR
jgi:poly-D-alanine transfer protein DltD